MVTHKALLSAKEKKSEMQKSLIAEHKKTLVSIGLNIPGTIKYRCEWRCILDEAYGDLNLVLKAVKADCIISKQIAEVTGAYYLVLSDLDPIKMKTIAVAIEERYPYRRLLDIDVYNPRGEQVHREDIGFESRSCFICDLPAKHCMRSRSHSSDLIHLKVNSWLEMAR